MILLLFLGQESHDPESLVRRREEQIQLHVVMAEKRKEEEVSGRTCLEGAAGGGAWEGHTVRQPTPSGGPSLPTLPLDRGKERLFV